MTRRFTGYHMAAILVGMFAIIIAVNVLMARAAISTFGGTVVPNSYVASQQFNAVLAAARAQERMGWDAEFALDGERRIVVTLTGPEGRIGDAKLVATAKHPIARLPDRVLEFAAISEQRYRSRQPLPEGRWNLSLKATHKDERAVFTGTFAE